MDMAEEASDMGAMEVILVQGMSVHMTMKRRSERKGMYQKKKPFKKKPFKKKLFKKKRTKLVEMVESFFKD